MKNRWRIEYGLQKAGQYQREKVDDVDGEMQPYYYWFAMDADEEAETRTTPSDFAFIDSVYTGRETIESIRTRHHQRISSYSSRRATPPPISSSGNPGTGRNESYESRYIYLIRDVEAA